MGTLFGLYLFLLKLYADSGYQGTAFQAGLRAVCGQVNLEIVRRCDRHRFVVLTVMPIGVSFGTLTGRAHHPPRRPE
jgi:hypothetical protein